MLRLAIAITLLLLAQAGTTYAGDRLFGIRPGMGGAEIVVALAGQCPDEWLGPPYVSCVKDRVVIGVSLTPKDRARYVSLRDPSDLPQKVYADALAAELGFEGPGEFCMKYDMYPQYCWYGDDGTVLYAGEVYPDGIYFSALDNERIEAEDGDD